MPETLKSKHQLEELSFWEQIKVFVAEVRESLPMQELKLGALATSISLALSYPQQVSQFLGESYDQIMSLDPFGVGDETNPLNLHPSANTLGDGLNSDDSETGSEEFMEPDSGGQLCNGTYCVMNYSADQLVFEQDPVDSGIICRGKME